MQGLQSQFVENQNHHPTKDTYLIKSGFASSKSKNKWLLVELQLLDDHLMTCIPNLAYRHMFTTSQSPASKFNLSIKVIE